MKLQFYLRFLRPLRSLLFVAIYTAIAESWGQYFLHLDWGTASFLALAVAVPLLLGFFIAGAAHEPMHRAFALTLPNLRQRQRTAAGVSVLIAALASTWAATWIAPTVTPIATFGLACALIAPACIDRHQRFRGVSAPVVGFLSWLCLGLAAAEKLPVVLNRFPWLFLLGGIAVFTVSLQQGFSRKTARIRAHIPFIAYQTNFCSYLFHHDMPARWTAEILVHRAKLKNGRASTGRDWPLAIVGPRLRDWLRVLDQQLGVSPVRKQVTLFVSVVIMITVQIAVFGALGQFNQSQPIHLANFFAALARLSAPTSVEPDKFYSLLIVIATFPTLIPMLHGQIISRPRLAYPLARTRLADLIFLHLSRDLLVGLLVPALAIWTSSLIGQVVNRHLYPGLGLPAVAAFVLAFSPFLPFVAMNNFPCQRTSGKFASRIGLFCFICLFLGVTTIGLTQGRTLIFSPIGISISVLVTGGGLERLRRRIRRYYATCDLPDGAKWAMPFSAPAAVR